MATFGQIAEKVLKWIGDNLAQTILTLIASGLGVEAFVQKWWNYFSLESLVLMGVLAICVIEAVCIFRLRRALHDLLKKQGSPSSEAEKTDRVTFERLRAAFMPTAWNFLDAQGFNAGVRIDQEGYRAFSEFMREARKLESEFIIPELEHERLAFLKMAEDFAHQLSVLIFRDGNYLVLKNSRHDPTLDQQLDYLDSQALLVLKRWKEMFRIGRHILKVN